MEGAHANFGRGSSPKPGQSIAIVAKLDASLSCRGRISRRVEIELKAGSSKTIGPSPRRSNPTRVALPPQFHAMKPVVTESFRRERLRNDNNSCAATSAARRVIGAHRRCWCASPKHIDCDRELVPIYTARIHADPARPGGTVGALIECPRTWSARRPPRRFARSVSEVTSKAWAADAFA